jgi:hypothetical protein
MSQNTIQINRLSKLLGPSGSFSGTIILITGLVALYYAWTAIFLVLIGAFAAFTGTVTIVDFGNRRIKYATSLFGIIMVGKWINAEAGMTLRVRQSGRVSRVYSRSNRPLDLRESDFSIVLKDARGREICPVKRFSDRESADNQVQELAVKLGIPVQP